MITKSIGYQYLAIVTKIFVTVAKLEIIDYCFKFDLLLLRNIFFNIMKNFSKYCQILLVVAYVTK